MKIQDVLGEKYINESLKKGVDIDTLLGEALYRIGINQNELDIENAYALKKYLKANNLKPRQWHEVEQPAEQSIGDKIYDGLGGIGLNFFAVANAALRDKDLAKKIKREKQGIEKRKDDLNEWNLSANRQEEIDKLKQDSAQAKGIWSNLGYGAKTLLDQLTHPSEWTISGITENILDPTNALSFGAGSIASKVAKNVLIKTAIGSVAGGIEGGIINSAYASGIDYGQNLDKDSAIKAALQGAGAGVAFGAGFGGIGGAAASGINTLGNTLGKQFKDSTPLPKKDTTQAQPISKDIPESITSVGMPSYADTPTQPIDVFKRPNNGWLNEKLNSEQNPIEKTKIEDNVATLQNQNNTSILKNLDGLEKAELESIQIQQLAKQGTDLSAIEVSENLKEQTLLINGEPVSDPRLEGTGIVSILHDNILNNSVDTAESFYNKLRQKGINREISALASEAFSTKDTAKFEEFLQNKLTEGVNNKIAQDLNNDIANIPNRDFGVIVKDGMLTNDIMNIKEPVIYKVVPANSINPNFISGTGTQFRYGNNESTIAKIQNRFDGDLHFGNDGGFDGIPVIDNQGRIVVGNHRAEAIRRMYQNKQGEEYQNQLSKHYPQADIQNINDPMLVRELVTQNPDRIDLVAKASNNGRDNNLADSFITNAAKVKAVENKLPATFSDFRNVAGYLGNQGINDRDANIGLLGYLNPNIVKNIDAYLKQGGDPELFDILVDNAYRIYNFKTYSKGYAKEGLDVSRMLDSAIFEMTKNKQRFADQLKEVIQDYSEIFLGEGQQRIFTDHYDIKDLKSKVMGVALKSLLGRLDGGSKEFAKRLNNALKYANKETVPKLNEKQFYFSGWDMIKFLLDDAETLNDMKIKYLSEKQNVDLDKLIKIERNLENDSSIHIQRDIRDTATLNFEGRTKDALHEVGGSTLDAGSRRGEHVTRRDNEESAALSEQTDVASNAETTPIERDVGVGMVSVRGGGDTQLSDRARGSQLLQNDRASDALSAELETHITGVRRVPHDREISRTNGRHRDNSIGTRGDGVLQSSGKSGGDNESATTIHTERATRHAEHAKSIEDIKQDKKVFVQEQLERNPYLYRVDEIVNKFKDITDENFDDVMSSLNDISDKIASFMDTKHLNDVDKNIEYYTLKLWHADLVSKILEKSSDPAILNEIKSWKQLVKDIQAVLEEPTLTDIESLGFKQAEDIAPTEDITPYIPKEIEGEKAAAQQQAETKKTQKYNDLEDIKKDLPYLLDEQAKDVKFAEERFSNGGRGVLFTNATGTGKTYTGLGIIKRKIKQGAKKILVITPSDTKNKDWIKDAKNLHIDMKEVSSIKDSPQDIAVVTYANFRMNEEIHKNQYDLIVYDESHNIMGNKQGTITESMNAHRKITIGNYIDELGGDWEKHKYTDAQYQEAIKLSRAKEHQVVFLSATPFASHKALVYGEGLLFDTPINDEFYIQNFGYRIRYSKLTQPESGVDVGHMERMFADKMKASGVMRGRVLDSKHDYNRLFLKIDGGVGNKVDEAMNILWQDKRFKALASHYNEKFDWHFINKLSESIKAQQTLDFVKDNIDLGRKVVVFHSYIKNDIKHPFIEDFNITHPLFKEYEMFKKEYPGFFEEFTAINPLDLYKKTFKGNVEFYNGQVSKSKRRQAIDEFNDDNSDIKLIVVQIDAGGTGISLHDTTGKHPRVSVKLNIPTKPITEIQSEGRTYRIGQESDTAFVYPTTHLGIEQRAFGRRINERIGTIENLALGAEARNLKNTFKQGYLNAMEVSAADLSFSGSKKIDRALDQLNDYEVAINEYRARKYNKSDGVDFYATPDPLGYMVNKWADISTNETILEPSAGAGGIAKYFSETTNATAIEPSNALFSKLNININSEHTRLINGNFEDLNKTNKFDGIVMNPPFGKNSKTAMEHIEKSFTHLQDGGRVVAIVPDGNSFKPKIPDNIEIVAEILLPSITFKKAGTEVNTKVLIMDKTDAHNDPINYDLREIRDIDELFSVIKNIEIPQRRRVERFLYNDNMLALINNNILKADDKNLSLQAVRGKRIDYDKFKQIVETAQRYGGEYIKQRARIVFKDKASYEAFKQNEVC